MTAKKSKYCLNLDTGLTWTVVPSADGPHLRESFSSSRKLCDVANKYVINTVHVLK